MNEEHLDPAGKTFPAEQAANDATEAEQKQSSRAASPRQVGGEGTVSGEYCFQNFRVQTLTQFGWTWFQGPEVCRGMGIRNSRQALSRLDDDEKGVTIINTNGGPQTVSLISESGLYALAMTSRKPQALAFRRWVTKEVLPAIRKNGFYAQNGSQPHSGDAIVLPAPDYPTRYVVSAFPGRPPHIRRTQWQAEMAERTTLDCEGLCYNLKTIEVWWQKVQQMQVAGVDPTGGFALARLERAIFEGASTADQYLTYGRPDVS